MGEDLRPWSGSRRCVVDELGHDATPWSRCRATGVTSTAMSCGHPDDAGAHDDLIADPARDRRSPLTTPVTAGSCADENDAGRPEHLSRRPRHDVTKRGFLEIRGRSNLRVHPVDGAIGVMTGDVRGSRGGQLLLRLLGCFLQARGRPRPGTGRLRLGLTRSLTIRADPGSSPPRWLSPEVARSSCRVILTSGGGTRQRAPPGRGPGCGAAPFGGRVGWLRRWAQQCVLTQIDAASLEAEP